jgi:hypothetical protein
MEDDYPIITHKGKTYTAGEVRQAIDFRESFLAPGRAAKALAERISKIMEDNPILMRRLADSELKEWFEMPTDHPGESVPRPGSIGVDPGGEEGFGLWATETEGKLGLKSISDIAPIYALTDEAAREFAKRSQLLREGDLVLEDDFMRVLAEFGGPDAVKRWFRGDEEHQTTTVIPEEALEAAIEKYDNDDTPAAGEPDEQPVVIGASSTRNSLLGLIGKRISDIGYADPGPGQEILVLHLNDEDPFKNELLVIEASSGREPHGQGSYGSLNISRIPQAENIKRIRGRNA